MVEKKGSCCWLLFIFYLMAVPVVEAGSDEVSLVRYNLSTDPKQNYYIDMLRLALEKSRDQYGDYRMQPVAMDMPQRRAIKLVEQGELDVVWTMTSQTRERRLLAVYFPLLKGLMGHRIAIIRRDDAARFVSIDSVEQLQSIPVGQGIDWPDSDILQRQGFTVIRAAEQNLLNMLEKHRFDYFLRALREPWEEVFDKPELMVEPSFVIIYPAPLYFFVHHDNLALSQRIEYGLRAALVDGSFDELFYHHTNTEGMLMRAELPNRRVFRMDNPFLSQISQNLLSESELWFH